MILPKILREMIENPRFEGLCGKPQPGEADLSREDENQKMLGFQKLYMVVMGARVLAERTRVSYDVELKLSFAIDCRSWCTREYK